MFDRSRLVCLNWIIHKKIPVLSRPALFSQTFPDQTEGFRLVSALRSSFPACILAYFKDQHKLEQSSSSVFSFSTVPFIGLLPPFDFISKNYSNCSITFEHYPYLFVSKIRCISSMLLSFSMIDSFLAGFRWNVFGYWSCELLVANGSGLHRLCFGNSDWLRSFECFLIWQITLKACFCSPWSFLVKQVAALDHDDFMWITGIGIVLGVESYLSKREFRTYWVHSTLA